MLQADTFLIVSDRRFPSSITREPFAYMRDPLGALDLRSCTVTSFAVRLLQRSITGKWKEKLLEKLGVRKSVTAGNKLLQIMFHDNELCDGLRARLWAKELFLAIPTESDRC